MKSRIVLIIAIVSCFFCTAQVGINTTTPDASSALEIESTNSGLLIPRLQETDKASIATPIAEGLLIFNTTTNRFEYYQGGNWFQISTFNTCDFTTVISDDTISLEKGQSTSLTLDVLTTGGTPGNITTTLSSTSSNINISGFSVSSTSPSPPLQQTINFTLDNSSSANTGDTAVMVLQIDSDCGITKFVTINITVTGCDFSITPDRIEASSTIPASGTNTLTFNLNIEQEGTINSAINSIFTTSSFPGLSFNASTGCNYPCTTSVSIDVSSGASPGTYPYSVTAQSNCGAIKMFTLTVIIEADPRDCKQILAEGNSTGDGIYQIDPDGIGSIAPFNCYCDMTTDGGGWTMVLNYVHQGGTNPTLSNLSSRLPLLGSSTLGDDESTSSTNWGHAIPVLLGNFNFSEIRIYANEEAPNNDLVHYKIEQQDFVDYISTGIGGLDVVDLRTNFVALAGHASTNNPVQANRTSTDRGDLAMTTNLYWRGNTLGRFNWEIRVGNDWSVNTNNSDFSVDTIHRIWIR